MAGRKDAKMMIEKCQKRRKENGKNITFSRGRSFAFFLKKNPDNIPKY